MPAMNPNVFDQGPGESPEEYAKRLRETAVKINSELSIANGKLSEVNNDLVASRNEAGMARSAAKKSKFASMVLAGVAVILAMLALYFFFTDYKSELKVAQGQLEMSQTEVKRLGGEIEKITGENTTLKDKLSKAEGVAKDADEKIDGLKKMVAKLEKRPESCPADRSSPVQRRSPGSGGKVVDKSYGAPFGGCGVKLAGVTFKELYPRQGSTCARDREIIVNKFKSQCYGKSGSDAGDRACGAKLTLD